MNFHTLIARNGGRRREIGAGEVSGENHHFPAAGAAADLGGGLGRDAEAEPVLLAPVPTAVAAAYAMVSGWSTKGYMTCPVCKEDVTSGWHAGKVCYLGHRRWLPWDHEWREKDKEFDGNTERHLRPREWSGDEILEQLNRLDFAPFEKTVSRTRPSTHMNWTHKPMFFELPYWSKLKLRHNLDVMHVVKNVFDTLVGTILDIEGKTKDTIKARLDLERMGIRRGLWMNRDSDKARRDLAFFSMKPNDKKSL
ncbi:hypothetical protein L3X38_041157 [Prunus dulcis]|uniref:Uncharacterized protein n=1 Tax=Prunus dulcis TaxID=3755 RepID=A0AAD4USJ0_PRUDU|nr:hypothetical protein L3X38_041157 [Prunus dulcis]